VKESEKKKNGIVVSSYIVPSGGEKETARE
jgi:hypothetical protein